MLPLSHFKDLVENAPLVSIDLIVRQREGILLGKRVNRPAQGFWFVPGGRVYKNESLADAFNRIVLKELGINHSLDQALFRGVYEHFYSDSFVSEAISTHYIVMAYEIKLSINLEELPLCEHLQYEYFDKVQLLNRSDVHRYTKNYFLKEGK
jgi:colanic acid biosynthesis protein WcaH